MKTIKNIIRILLIITILFGASIGKMGMSYAATPIDSAYLYEKSSYGNMLMYNGIEVLTTFVVYQKDGVEYPAYCLDKDMPGVGEKGSYTVTTKDYLNDVMLWRVITNGYPYKTVAQLGCNTKEEAFAATKQAVYCMLYGREASWYSPIGESGKRVVNAMTQILQNARNSTSTKPSSDISVEKLGNEWVIDNINKNYLSQSFKVTSSLSSNNCNVSLVGDYPDGAKIVDNQNNAITSIKSGNTFKIILPIQSMKKDGEFKINVKATLATKPVLYGKAPNSGYQDYAVTASMYEDATGQATIKYSKNNTKIVIQKVDSETKKPIEGVTFRVLNSNKEAVYTDLVSDSKGIITINNIVPGKYFIEELKTKEGYVKYDKQIECNLVLNQTLTVTVNNSKPTVVKEEEKNTHIVVNKNEAQVIVDKLDTTININENNDKQVLNDLVINKNEQTTNKDFYINNENKNENVDNTNTNVDVDNTNTNVNKDETNTNVDVDNINTNVNKDETNTNVDVDNINTNVNKDETNTNVDVDNINTNVNKEETNTNVDVDNTNTNVNTDNTNTNVDVDNTNTNVNKDETNTKVDVDNTNTNVNKDETNTKVDVDNANTYVNKDETNTKVDVDNTNINVNTNNTNTNVNVGNANTNINTQNGNTNVNVNNTNSNINQLNGIVKLPKTGM